MPDSAVKVRLKWFNFPKGFGFVIPEDESFDAFLHVTKLQQAGVISLGEGACLLCHIERGVKGAQVTEVVAMLDEGVQPVPIRGELSARGNHHDGSLSRLSGMVKLYNHVKGFGFVETEDGQKDVFLHKNCLKRHGLQSLEPGTQIVMKVRNTLKGREAVDFEFLDE